MVQENLHGIRVVKSFVREEQEKEKFSQVSRSIFRDFVKAEHILAFNNPMMQTAAYTCMLLISWFGAKMVLASGDNRRWASPQGSFPVCSPTPSKFWAPS